MAIENNIIKSPIHLAANVARLLQTNKMTVASLCTHPNINMWAKYKPFKYSAIAIDDINDSYRKSALWGFANPVGFPFWSWSYERPTAVFRLGDFRSYYHAALAPFTIGVMDVTLQVVRIDNKTGDIDIESLKGFTGEGNADTNGVEVTVTEREPNGTYKNYELALSDIPASTAFDHCLVAIQPEDGTYTEYYELEQQYAPGVTVFSGKIPSKTVGRYKVGLSHLRGALTDHVSASDAIPLLASRSVFMFNFKEVTVFQNAVSDLSARMQVYVEDINTVTAQVVTGNGQRVSVEWRCFHITDLKMPSATINFDYRYARSVYLFLMNKLIITGTDNIVTYAPIRIVTSSDLAKGNLQTCIENGYWVSWLDLQAVSSYHYDTSVDRYSKTIGGNVESLFKDGIDNRVWICLPTQVIQQGTPTLNMDKGITARKVSSITSTDCGTLETGTKDYVSFKNITKAQTWY